ncbi:uncharacterized protein LOC120110489 isoform X3 [Phoenix dactylifera]|uniref:4a-hydroxytetrahydrobiopterin dehydratase n=1 Tax=Phoenix dactylifera TaxID=42345 RepID=A0A8B9AC53_PHODC|nr:uncharacterized protein LOC120110489 isoform X3 [Phoenix dactylifera]
MNRVRLLGFSLKSVGFPQYPLRYFQEPSITKKKKALIPFLRSLGKRPSEPIPRSWTGHYLDLHLVGWNNAKIDIWIHSVGGLNENDFILAAKINSLHLEHLLRRKAAAYEYAYGIRVVIRYLVLPVLYFWRVVCCI